jgi:hypothetical protein
MTRSRCLSSSPGAGRRLLMLVVQEEVTVTSIAMMVMLTGGEYQSFFTVLRVEL